MMWDDVELDDNRRTGNSLTKHLICLFFSDLSYINWYIVSDRCFSVHLFTGNVEFELFDKTKCHNECMH